MTAPTEVVDAAADDLVTVVVPARDEAGSISRCLDSILSQRHPALQVIVVVDGRSRDDTLAIARTYADADDRVEVIVNDAGGISRSLNRALRVARGRWFVRVDAHSTVPSDYVGAVVSHLRTGRWGGVGGRKDGVGHTAAGRAIAAALGSPFGVGDSMYHHGTAVQTVDHVPFGAYPTELVRRLGGWDERLDANEDFELDFRLRRAGHELLLDPRVAISWTCRQSIGDLFRQYERYGRGKARVARLHPSSMRPRHFAPPALVAWLAAAAIVAPWRPRWSVAAVAPYVCGVALGTVLTARRVGDRRALPYLPAAFVSMHVAWGLGFWRGFVASFAGRGEPSSAASRQRDVLDGGRTSHR